MTQLYAITQAEYEEIKQTSANMKAVVAELKALRLLVAESCDVQVSTAEAAEMLGFGANYLLRLVADGRKMPRHATTERLIVQKGRVYLKNYSPDGWGKFSKADIIEWRRLFGQDHERAVNQNTHSVRSQAGV
jgi:hypothetical protein